jgi:hypothetical protein
MLAPASRRLSYQLQTRISRGYFEAFAPGTVHAPTLSSARHPRPVLVRSALWESVTDEGAPTCL